MDEQHYKQRFVLQSALPHPADPARQPAAVLLAIDVARQQLLLTRRARHLRHHPGQISLPGGRHDPEDTDLQATALREAFEEIGLAPRFVKVLGELPKRSTVSNFTVTPFVAEVSGDYQLRHNPEEVEQILQLPLQPFLYERAYHTHEIQRNGELHKVLFIVVGGELVWGATARILHDFALHCQAGSKNGNSVF